MDAFDKIIGYEDTKAELRRYCDVLKNPERYAKLGVTMPRGIMLCGEPGIGKTTLAKSFIEECGCKAFLLRKNLPNGDFVKEIRATFDKAKNEQCAIVFLDDMDKFANEDSFHTDAEEYVTVQACIDDCRDLRVFVLATVNNCFNFPQSLMRAGRFDKVIELNMPEGRDAEKIIEYYLKQKQIVGEIEASEIARLLENKSCAEIETVINEAAIYAGYDKREKVGQNDIVRACMRIMFSAPESTEEISEEEIKLLAVHEAGHALIAEVFAPGSVSLVSILGYSGLTKGVTVTHKPKMWGLSLDYVEHSVIRALGGKAATEIVMNQVGMGCGEDIEHAFELVDGMIDGDCVYGFDAYEGERSSEYLRENKDRAVAREITRCYEKAKQIIRDNRGLLDALIEELAEKKTLMHKDIMRIREKTLREAC
ncbi:MAG: AAA family ATPase [Lachnospiraceae bacterium]|nr:AAA family ATPase [Lachnospiraceae bacterium]